MLSSSIPSSKLMIFYIYIDTMAAGFRQVKVYIDQNTLICIMYITCE